MYGEGGTPDVQHIWTSPILGLEDEKKIGLNLDNLAFLPALHLLHHCECFSQILGRQPFQTLSSLE